MEVSPPQYGPRCKSDEICPEFCNEAAHYLICQDVLSSKSPADLFEDVLKGTKLGLESRTKVREAIKSQVIAVATREGRPFVPKRFVDKKTDPGDSGIPSRV